MNHYMLEDEAGESIPQNRRFDKRLGSFLP